MIRRHSRHRRLANAARSAAAISVALALTGCIRTDVDLTIDGETVDGFMILGVEREFPDMAEMDPDQFDIPEGSTVEPWEDDEYVGQRVVLDSVEVSEFDDPEFILIDYDTNAGRYEITGQMDMTDMGDA